MWWLLLVVFVSLCVSVSSVGWRNSSKMAGGVSRPGTTTAGEYTVWAGWKGLWPKEGYGYGVCFLPGKFGRFVKLIGLLLESRGSVEYDTRDPGHHNQFPYSDQ